jgi:peptidoglycan DL-endopeptidase CwlO
MTDVVRLLGLLLLIALAVGTGACAARSTAGGTAKGPVPRPFPGAPLPPSADRAEAPPPATATATPRPEPVETPVLSALISTALGFRGTPYRNGGTDPSGFDCSGFVQYVFAKHGLTLPREVRDQFHVGSEVKRGELHAGDLVFFETVSRGASHVGMAIGGDQFVHAPSSRGVVRVERLTASYWASRFVGARRLQ